MDPWLSIGIFSNLKTGFLIPKYFVKFLFHKGRQEVAKVALVRIQPLAAVCVKLGAAAKRLHAIFPRQGASRKVHNAAHKKGSEAYERRLALSFWED